MRVPTIIIAGFLAVGAMFCAASAQAQQATSQGRDCQTVRTCNFARTGSVRGCLSSYTCRTCRLVPAKCAIGIAGGRCQEMRCGWGG